MRILTATSPVEPLFVGAAEQANPAVAVAAILIAAGFTYDNPKSQVLIQQKHLLKDLWPTAEATWMKYAGKTKAAAIRKFRAWCENPPKDDKNEEAFAPYEDAFDTFLTRNAAQKIKADGSLTQEESDVMISAFVWARGGSNTAFAKLRKMGSAIGLPAETLTLLAAESASQEKPAAALKALLTKAKLPTDPSTPLKLTIEQSVELKTRNPVLHKKYTDLRKELVGAYKTELQNFVRSKGGPQPIDEVRRHMQSKGFIVTTLPEGFVGKIGDDGSLYTTAGKKIAGSASTRVRMNPKYNAELDNGYVFTYKPTPTSKEQSIYTEDWKKRANNEKFELTKKFEENLDTVMKKIHTDLRSTDAQKRVLATMLQLQYLTAMRIGNAGNGTKSDKGEIEPTFGMSTLQVGHVRVVGGGLKLSFSGKSGVSAKYTLAPSDAIVKKVIENIQELLKNPDGSAKTKADYVFQDNTGRYNSTRVNKYLKAVSGMQELTNHKIRHLRGTTAAREILKTAPAKMDQKTAEAWFMKAMTKVGELLNHVKGVGADQKVTPTTAINNYIDPNLSISFFTERGLRLPKLIAKLKR